MALFDEILRTDLRPRRQNEASFDYMNVSARPGIRAIRELLEGWFDHLPDTAKADVRGRFRSRDEIQNQSSFFELSCHELLLRSEYEVEIHPEVPNANTVPDFLANRQGIPHFYFEATLATPPRTELMADRRFAELHDTLNRIDTPDYFLKVEYRGDPQSNISGRRLRQRLERWLDGLDFEAIAQLYRERNYEAVPTFPWTDAGCNFAFKPIPKGPQFRGQPDARPVGVVVPMEMRQLSTHEDIRAAIDGKATKYGHLDHPLVVAVNVTDDFCDDDDVWNALFGDDQFIATRQADGQWRHGPGIRVPNGALRGRAGPRNVLVSAVIVVHQLSPSTLRSHSMELIHNPWAVHALPPNALRIPQCMINADGRNHRRPGVDAADILGVPDPWPVPDQR